MRPTGVYSKVIHTKVCPICGKSVSRISWVDYTYKLETKKGLQFYCSYTCFEKAKRKSRNHIVNKIFTDENDKMCHALGLSYQSPISRKTVYSYRNRYVVRQKEEYWEQLVKDGLAKMLPFDDSSMMYVVTLKGVRHLEQKYGVIITQDKEDIYDEEQNI